MRLEGCAATLTAIIDAVACSHASSVLEEVLHAAHGVMYSIKSSGNRSG